jgi:hypothetical protein
MTERGKTTQWWGGWAFPLQKKRHPKLDGGQRLPSSSGFAICPYRINWTGIN